MKRYNVKSTYIKRNFTNRKLSYLIDNIRCNDIMLIKPFIEVYTTGKTLINTYYSNWKVIGSEYQPLSTTFNINSNEMSRIGYYKVGFLLDGATLHNKLYFNHLQLAEGTVNKYHQPESTIPKTSIKLINNFYVNLYQSTTDNYLQVIRPYYNNFDTETLTKSKVTVLAPHLANEDDIDSPQNIGLEFMNASDQVIEILR